jgi:ABC-type antimicrobial peptide transport system permease subunit
MRETVLIIGFGLALGLFAAFIGSRVVENFLFQIKPTDVFTFLSGAIFVGAVAAISAYFPTRKAVRLEVMAALRS